MKIYDCFLFNDENTLLDLRLHILNKYVDYFVIIESKFNHQNKIKGQKIHFKLLKKFKKKIKYFYINKNFKNQNSWQIENAQRNLLSLGLKKCNQDDIIIISDLDEIPNLKNFNFTEVKNQIVAFKQINSMYKLNTIRDKNWYGSKLCKYKHLKSPQWLRNIKVQKKYSLFRLDKIFFSKNYYHNFKIINNGGWHFGWIRNEKEIIKKLNSFAHTELNTKKNNNISFIKNCIINNKNFFNNKKLIKIKLKYLPEYVQNNLKNFKKIISL